MKLRARSKYYLQVNPHGNFIVYDNLVAELSIIFFSLW